MKRFFGTVLMLLSCVLAVGGGYYLAYSGKLYRDVAYVYLFGIGTGATGALGSLILAGSPKKKG